MTSVAALRDQARDLAWSLWAELGVSTWQRAHEDWSVEVEPLIAYTAVIGRDDPRLLRESVDWCVSQNRFISLHQFRHVVTGQRWPHEGEIARFGATVAVHTKRRWPGKPREGPYAFGLSGKSQLPSLLRPALLQLRLRALFGVGARAEIVRVLLMKPADAWIVREIAERAAYTRRQITLDLEMLVHSGLLQRAMGPGPAAVALRDPASLLALVGPLPRVTPRWAPLLRCVSGLIEALEAATQGALHAPAAELARRLRLLAPELEAARLTPPSPRGLVDVEVLAEWTSGLLSALASGRDELLTGPAWLRSRGS